MIECPHADKSGARLRCRAARFGEFPGPGVCKLCLAGEPAPRLVPAKNAPPQFVMLRDKVCKQCPHRPTCVRWLRYPRCGGLSVAVACCPDHPPRWLQARPA
jgi:hypothetical protein